MSFIYNLQDTRWSNAGTTYNGIWMDFTNGSGGSAVGAAASRTLNLTNNGSNIFSIDLNGTLYNSLNGGNSQFSIGSIHSGSPVAACIFSVFGTEAAAVNGYNSGVPGFGAPKTGVFAFASASNSGYAPDLDTYLQRRMRAIVSVNGAFAFQSLTLASLSASIATAASAGAGAIAYINDGLAPTLNATAVGGGTVPCIVHSDGTQWRT